MDSDGVSASVDNGALIKAAHQRRCHIRIRETERRFAERCHWRRSSRRLIGQSCSHAGETTFFYSG